MSRKQISLACDLNTVTWPLYEGLVEPKGADVNFLPFDDVNDMFERMFLEKEFDAAELFMSSYFIALDQGIDDFVAIPVFPSRVFRHGFIFVNDDSGIRKPEDLKGKDIGVRSYSMTAALWQRGILQHEYGVKPSDMHWHQLLPQGGGEDDPLEISIPDEVELDHIPEGRTLDGMLADGEIDAFAAPYVTPSYDGEQVRRLFPDYRDVEEAYYKKTGHFPIMHCIVLKRDVYEEHKWLATSLTNAFIEAKDRALSKLKTGSRKKIAVPWTYQHIERVRDTIGEDYWPYGVDANRHTLEAMAQFEHEQGLTSSKIDVDELFAPNTY
jgi:4,5-dihydroxyphthalate decarboxylase